MSTKHSKNAYTSNSDITLAEYPGALVVRPLDNGQVLVVYRMIFNDRLCIGDQGDVSGYRRAWCYPQNGSAAAAARVWDGIGQPPFGWVKEVGVELCG